MTQTKPTIHLGGSAYGILLEGYKAAAIAVNEALRSLEECAPHGRDYYPQGEGALASAMSEHTARCHKLTEVRAELIELLNHVQDTIDQRAAQRR